MKTIYSDTNDYPSYEDMASDRCARKHNIPFISVPYNVGSTSHLYAANASTQKHSFGCPRFFFRLNITSAIQQVPYALVDWCKFRAQKFSRSCFEGAIGRNEWSSGPSFHANLNPFVTMDDILPSRFVLAYESNTADVAFLSLDPERIMGETVDDGRFTDFGDNVLHDNRSDMRSFLRSDINNRN